VATISLKSVNESCGATPSSICAGIVEETSSTVYVIEKKLWDPNAWRNRTMHIPQPTAISRDQIVMIEYPSSDVQSSPVAKK
jgi:hypothetical protein